MPGFLTHYIHGEAVLNQLGGEDIRKTILSERTAYNLGTQGPDVFFYYLPALVKKSIFGVGTKMHRGNFALFLRGMAEDIRKSGSELEKSYLYGYITHYALDAAAHPYIYYKTGSRKEGHPASLRYSVYHRSFETALDVLMLRLSTGEKVSDKRLWQLIKTSGKKLRALSADMARNIVSAYSVRITAGQVRRAFGLMTFVMRVLQSDRGRRKRLFEFVEGITVHDKIVSSLIHHGSVDKRIDYLNEKRAKWALPWDNKAERDHSFTDMFEAATDHAVSMTEACGAYFRGETGMDELLAVAKNMSFATGLPYDENVEFRFADIVYGKQQPFHRNERIS